MRKINLLENNNSIIIIIVILKIKKHLSCQGKYITVVEINI